MDSRISNIIAPDWCQYRMIEMGYIPVRAVGYHHEFGIQKANISKRFINFQFKYFSEWIEVQLYAENEGIVIPDDFLQTFKNIKEGR